MFPAYKVTKEDDSLPFRFLNLVEAKITVSADKPQLRRITGANWTDASGIYRNPSFLQIKSEPFETKRSITHLPDRVLFTQTTGARTVSPEVIGEIGGALLGGPIASLLNVGRKVAHEVKGFPPIWTTVRLTIFADGRFDSVVVCNSLFPSMSFYEMRSVMGAAAGTGTSTATPSSRSFVAEFVRASTRATTSYNLIGGTYDARPNLERWNTDGWGALGPNASGPSPGNPWGYRKENLTVRETSSQQRMV